MWYINHTKLQPVNYVYVAQVVPISSLTCVLETKTSLTTNYSAMNVFMKFIYNF